MKMKLRQRDAVPQDGFNAVLEALEENSPQDAKAAKGVQKVRMQDDVNAILAALEANNPEDAAAARQSM